MKKLASPIGLIVVTFLALALAYGVVVPPFEALDEVEHFGVTRYVAETGRLPVQGDGALATYHIRQEASQPPLYYLVAGPLLRLTGIPTADTSAYLTPNPYVTCGTENIRADKAVLRHNPFAEGFPWHDVLLALHLLRALSTVMQAFTIAGVYAIAKRVFPDRRGVATLAAALTAFNPQFLIVAGGVNNDNIATPVVTWAVYGIVVVAQEGLSFRRALVLGVLIGLAALSKLTGLLLLPLVVLALVPNIKSANRQSAIIEGKRPRNLQSAIRNLVILGSATLAVAGWWYLRNWQLYGDPTGLSPMLDVVGRRSAVPLGLLFSEFGLVFRSYWGQFPCAFFDSAWYYTAWIVIAGLGWVGLVWGLRRDKAIHVSPTGRKQRFTFYVLFSWLALVFIGWLRWNLTTPAPGGRLLFTAVGATSTLLAYGLACLPSLLSPRSKLHALHSTLPAYVGSAVMAGVGLLALLVGVRPLFAPPPMVDAAHIRPQHSLQAQFGESVALLGYDLRADGLGPGRYVDVTLYWRALRPMSVDTTLALQLAALAPGDTRTLLNFNTWPGSGNLPTSAWRVGPVMADRYRVPLPVNTGLTQAWRFQALVYDAQTDTRLPLTLDARPAGDVLTLGTVRVAGTSIPSLPDATRLATPVTFDQAIALTHAQVVEQAGGVQVRLLWQSLKPLPNDVTVFVHAEDAGGTLLATGDGPPMGRNFPTSLWRKGDWVLDDHTLNLPAGLSLNDVRVTVGLYRPEDGRRLPATQSAKRLPNDAVVIQPR
jgi:hypothetical protein